MTSAAGQNREIEQLKTLLFQTESARLETLETDVAFLQQYVGGAERLEAATADILIAALERAEVKRPRELANAIAPSVVSAIRSEIKNSRELMIDALYPITGRLVSAAVGNAFKELVAFVEQRINALTSTELWIGRVKSLATGRPISEFVLADGNPPRINRLLILERGSGRLIADWTDGGISDERADMLSAMVAAILEFSVQAFAGEGDLQKLDFGGREIVLRASPRFILAAECTGGSLRPADDARINSLFLDTIESMDRGSNCDAAMLASLAASIERDPSSGKNTNRRGKLVLLMLAALVAVALAWLAAGFVAKTMLERRTNAALQQLAIEQPLLEAFPLRLDFDHSNRSLVVSGIEPDQVDLVPLVDALAEAAAPYRIVNRIGVVPGLEQSSALRSDIAAVQQSLARIAADVVSTSEQSAALRADVAAVQQSLVRLEAGLLAASEESAAVRADVAATQESLARMQSSIGQTRDAIGEESRSRHGQFVSLKKQYTGLSDQYSGLTRQLASLKEQHDALKGQYDGLNQHYARLQSVVDSPAERLGRFMASTAIFFGKGDEFADREQTERQIGQLAELLSDNDLRIRIVGYTDDTGSAASNRILARKRAEQVMRGLISRGIEPSRLFVVSRPASMPISDGAANGANRRVAFETVFQSEAPQ
jgi:outer membrane protein OmpA-like peptidoglycan-associated protein